VNCVGLLLVIQQVCVCRGANGGVWLLVQLWLCLLLLCSCCRPAEATLTGDNINKQIRLTNATVAAVLPGGATLQPGLAAEVPQGRIAGATVTMDDVLVPATSHANAAIGQSDAAAVGTYGHSNSGQQGQQWYTRVLSVLRFIGERVVAQEQRVEVVAQKQHDVLAELHGSIQRLQGETKAGDRQLNDRIEHLSSAVTK